MSLPAAHSFVQIIQGCKNHPCKYEIFLALSENILSSCNRRRKMCCSLVLYTRMSQARICIPVFSYRTAKGKEIQFLGSNAWVLLSSICGTKAASVVYYCFPPPKLSQFDPLGWLIYNCEPFQRSPSFPAPLIDSLSSLHGAQNSLYSHRTAPT